MSVSPFSAVLSEVVTLSNEKATLRTHFEVEDNAWYRPLYASNSAIVVVSTGNTISTSFDLYVTRFNRGPDYKEKWYAVIPADLELDQTNATHWFQTVGEVCSFLEKQEMRLHRRVKVLRSTSLTKEETQEELARVLVHDTVHWAAMNGGH
jgi:hypothetical protein